MRSALSTQATDTLGASRTPLIAIAILIVVAILLGGGGMRYALANLAVQLVALCILAIRRDSVVAFWREAPTPLRMLILLSFLIPAAQLVPLPESIWSALPGRELVKQSFELTGRTGWAPHSVDPVRTLVALTGMIVPFAVLTAGWDLRRPQLWLLGWLVVLLALTNFLIGIPQVLSGSALIYTDESSGIILGTFANRNSTGVFLVGALALAALLPSPRDHPAVMGGRIAIGVLLIIGIVLTRSRTALVLTSIPLLLMAFRAFWWNGHSRPVQSKVARRTKLAVLAAMAIALFGTATILITSPGRVADTVERFEASDDARRYIWEDAYFSASRYWPIGSGMGTFDEVVQVDESLENAAQRRAGRAHNEYLEVAIEAGLPGLTMIALWLSLIAWLVWRARRSDMRWTAWAAASFLLAIALQSITDYPLRNQAILAEASFALLILARIGSDQKKQRT